MSRRNLGGGYIVEIQRVDDGWYWHLYWRDDRVNGGLSDTWSSAVHAARNGCTSHARWSPSPPSYDLEI
jgi:hypothetical protein